VTSETPEQRVLHAKRAQHIRWAGVADPAAETAPARAAFHAKFEAEARQLHPDGSPETIARAAEHLRKAHMARLALASSKARVARKGGAAGG
jgi:hypothetical protein